MTESHVTAPSGPARKAGKRGKRPAVHVPELRLHNFRRAAPEPPPAAADVSCGIVDWGMLGNDTIGDCGPCATEHDRMVKACVSPATPTAAPGYEQGFVMPTAAATLSLYYAYGIAQGEPGPSPDQGVDNASWLAWLFSQGVIEAYAEVDVASPGAADRVHRAMVDFRGVIVGTHLTDDAEALFEAHEPWTTATGESPDTNKGHDILLVAYDDTGDTFVTWGADQKSTLAWDAACIDEAWVILTKEDADRAGYDFAAALKAIHDHLAL